MNNTGDHQQVSESTKCAVERMLDIGLPLSHQQAGSSGIHAISQRSLENTIREIRHTQKHKYCKMKLQYTSRNANVTAAKSRPQVTQVYNKSGTLGVGGVLVGWCDGSMSKSHASIHNTAAPLPLGQFPLDSVQGLFELLLMISDNPESTNSTMVTGHLDWLNLFIMSFNTF